MEAAISSDDWPHHNRGAETIQALEPAVILPQSRYLLPVLSSPWSFLLQSSGSAFSPQNSSNHVPTKGKGRLIWTPPQ